MSKVWMASVVVALLAACSAQYGTDNGRASEVSQGSGYNPFPGGLTMPSNHHLREDRFHVSKEKRHLRRKVVLEILDQEIGQSIEEVERLMHVAGYRASGDPTSTRKATRLKFKKKGSPTIAVDFRPELDKNPANPRAGHLVVFTWKVTESLDAWMAERGGGIRN